MGESDMYDFLSAIDECCREVSTSWIVSSELDPKPLQEIRSHIQAFALEKGSDILSLYNFAENRGRYQFVSVLPLMNMLCDYEKYHDEFFGFIKAACSPDWRIKDVDEALVYLQRGEDADKNFRKKLFETAPARVPVSAAIENLEVIMGLTIFTEKVYDNFVCLNSLEVCDQKVKEAIRIYQESSLTVLRTIFELYMGFINYMVEVRDNAPCEIKRKHRALLLI